MEFFAEHSQGTNFIGEQSDFQQINASIIQGSGLGPATYVVNEADLVPNQSIRLIPSSSMLMILSALYLLDMTKIEQWPLANNLKLNCLN